MEAKLRAGYQRRGIKPDRAHVNRDFMTAVAPRTFEIKINVRWPESYVYCRHSYCGPTVCIGDSTGNLLLVPPGADDELKREVETTS